MTGKLAVAHPAPDLPGLLEQVSKIDLGPIKKKLMSAKRHGGQEWDEGLANEAIGFYQKFLALCWAYPTLRLVPTRDIDAVWHTHILDTKKYAEDCSRVFGYFLHHNPNYSPELVGGNTYKHSAQRTVDLFREHFGHEPKGDHMLCSGFPCDAGECSS